MDEVLEISDRISVLRDGMLVETSVRADFDRVRLLSRMVGREMRVIPRRTWTAATDRTVLEVKALAHAERFKDIGFAVHAGEVVGLAGLVGAGRTEIAETIFGIRRADAGSVSLNGEDITGQAPHAVMKRGLVYVPEDRAKHGAVLPMTIAENLSSALLDRVRKRAGLIDRREETRTGAETAARLRVRCAHVGQALRELSGGNQQKVVFGKWMGLGPSIAILDEPTRGVDAGAKDEIYELIEQLAREGIAILVISSEMEELVRLCDRVISIYEGRVVAELAGDGITPDRVTRSYLSHEGLAA
jgi:ABC-type sugar transport system ATPase subunit